MYKIVSVLVLASSIIACSSSVSDSTKVAAKQSDLPVMASNPKAELGAGLFFDTNLSKHRNQSCASCHDIASGFADGREQAKRLGVSVGSDGISTGGRNAPTASYAALTPIFHQTSAGVYRGGQFWDGRASTLADQAAGPFLNPVEMQLSSVHELVTRIQENTQYVNQINELYGETVWLDESAVYAAVTDAITHFEMTESFMPFDSKYDRMLRGEVTFTPQEELGKTLFFSQQFTNCNSCHQLNKSPFYARETFTNYEYRNIGVPANERLNVPIDEGLFANPLVNDASERGKFKVPTLRNVAVTGPYMHNGVFQDLRTVVEFYDHFNNPKRQINPETGESWGSAEIPENIDLATLEAAPALNDQRIDALVAFMKTLTDQRYEHLLQQ